MSRHTNLYRSHGADADRARAVFMKTLGTPMPDQIRMCFGEGGVVYTQSFIEECNKLFWTRAKNVPVELFPGTRETLQELHRQGKVLFATSGTENELTESFRLNSLPPFALILGSDRIPKGIEHIRAFARHAGLSFEEFASFSVLIGDGPTDMRIAKESGIIAVGVTTTTTSEILIDSGAKITIPSFSDILSLEI